MNIRALNPSDIALARRIHEKFYKEEFNFPNFLNFDCSFVIQDGIILGGVRPIAEVIIVTDKDFSVRERRKALHKMLEASIFTAKAEGYEHLHVFINDETYSKGLKEVGFEPAKGECLVYKV